MNYKFFVPTPTTAEEAISLYRKLAHEHHPDKGGSEEAMKQVNEEYSHLITELEKTNQRQRQAQAHSEDRKTAADYHDLDEVIETLRVKIEFALNLEGVTVELCGLWVWLTGNTREHKETIKANTAGEKIKWSWAKNKQAWFYAGVPSFNRKEKSLDEIRSMHGSQQFTRRQRREEEAAALPA